MGIFNFKNDAELPSGYNDENSEFYVPSELRDDYKAASVDFAAIAPHLKHRVEMRANADYNDHLAAWKARSRLPGEDYEGAKKARQATIDAGPQAGDEVYAEHAYRMEYAQALKSARDAERERERLRQARRCRVCGALDIPTAPVVVRLSEPTRSQPSAMVATLPGGPVCADCSPVVSAEYIATTLAGASIDAKGTTRREAAHQFLQGGRTSQ